MTNIKIIGKNINRLQRLIFLLKKLEFTSVDFFQVVDNTNLFSLQKKTDLLIIDIFESLSISPNQLKEWRFLGIKILFLKIELSEEKKYNSELQKLKEAVTITLQNQKV